MLAAAVQRGLLLRRGHPETEIIISGMKLGDNHSPAGNVRQESIPIKDHDIKYNHNLVSEYNLKFLQVLFCCRNIKVITLEPVVKFHFQRVLRVISDLNS